MTSRTKPASVRLAIIFSSGRWWNTEPTLLREARFEWLKGSRGMKLTRPQIALTVRIRKPTNSPRQCVREFNKRFIKSNHKLDKLRARCEWKGT